MSGTLIDYLNEYGDRTLWEYPMNDVDSLALCQLSYLKFDGMVPDVWANKPFVTLRDIALHGDYERVFADSRYVKDNKALFKAMVTGKRFGGIKLNCHINLIELEQESQFSAVTFLLEDGNIYIAYRGTDETIVGWKEDFNMVLLSPVPGQALSVKYLNMVMGKINRPFYIGGHSKGGNLAVYASMYCIPQVQDRIRKIYTMDGPGFRTEILKSDRYKKIADRIVKILPQSSMVGMIFENDSNYQVVESKTFGLAQHNSFKWKVKDGDFCRVDDLYQSRKFLNQTFNEWLLSLEEEQIRTFVDTLYNVVSASSAESLIEFTEDWIKSMNSIITALKEVDDQTKNILRAVIKSLFDLTRQKVKEEITLKPRKPKKRNKKEGDHR